MKFKAVLASVSETREVLCKLNMVRLDNVNLTRNYTAYKCNFSFDCMTWLNMNHCISIPSEIGMTKEIDIKKYASEVINQIKDIQTNSNTVYVYFKNKHKSNRAYKSRFYHSIYRNFIQEYSHIPKVQSYVNENIFHTIDTTMTPITHIPGFVLVEKKFSKYKKKKNVMMYIDNVLHINKYIIAFGRKLGMTDKVIVEFLKHILQTNKFKFSYFDGERQQTLQFDIQ